MIHLKGKVVAVCRSDNKGERKINIKEGIIKKNFGLVNDAHSSCNSERQLSLLSIEEIKKFDLSYGEFAENITIEGIDINKIKLDDIIILGNRIKLKVTQIGKMCDNPCEIYKKLGRCIMQTKGIFTRVLTGGKVKVGDSVRIIKNHGHRKGTRGKGQGIRTVQKS